MPDQALRAVATSSATLPRSTVGRDYAQHQDLRLTRWAGAYRGAMDPVSMTFGAATASVFRSAVDQSLRRADRHEQRTGER